MATPTTPRTRRPGGSGNLYVRTDAAGRETWYATWYEHGRKVKRRIGRKDGENGLSKRVAERELRRLMAESASRPQPERARSRSKQVGQRLIERLAGVGRKARDARGLRERAAHPPRAVLRRRAPSIASPRATSSSSSRPSWRTAARRRSIRNVRLLNSIYAYAERTALSRRTRCAQSTSRAPPSARGALSWTRPSWRPCFAPSRTTCSAVSSARSMSRPR